MKLAHLFLSFARLCSLLVFLIASFLLHKAAAKVEVSDNAIIQRPILIITSSTLSVSCLQCTGANFTPG